ncbi:MAG: hypothetical protein QXS54_05240 [Candidatus Methanomethylicaceae archaeon]
MGRFVFKIWGNLDFEWKYEFAEQCSNFGMVAKELEGDQVLVLLYNGEDGEFIRIRGNKADIINSVDSAMKKIGKCPICGQDECAAWTSEMLKEFKQKVEEQNEEKIDALLFSEF